MTQTFNRDKNISYNEYKRVHYWLKVNFGKASKCESSTCKGTSTFYNWALKDGCKYEKKRENFLELCRACHNTYDFTPEGKKKIAEYSLKNKHYLLMLLHRWGTERSFYVNCPICNKEFKAKKVQTQKYCSKACYSQSQKESMKGNTMAVSHPPRWYSWNKDSKKWNVKYRGKSYGYFKTEEEAKEKVKSIITNLT